MPRTKKGIRRTALEIEKTLKNPIKTKENINPSILFPTGSSLLNLACSDNIEGGFKMGTIITLPGSSGGGKTMLAVSALALAYYSGKFNNYDYVYDDGERALNFDMDHLFGKRFPKILKSPPLGISKTIQHFQSNILTIIKKEKRKTIYILDSLDSLSSDEELEKEMRKALAMAKSEEAAKKISGSFNTEKAKILGQTLRMINDGISDSESLLIIIQQRRQKINALPFSDPWTTSGGHAPFFYSSHQIWLNKKGDIKHKKHKDREIGTKVIAKVKKNKITGKRRSIEFNIYEDYGVDDTGSMVEFLIDKGIWEKKGHTIYTNLGIEGRKADLPRIIEENHLQNELRKEVQKQWMIIEEEIKMDRKPKFQ